MKTKTYTNVVVDVQAGEENALEIILSEYRHQYNSKHNKRHNAKVTFPKTWEELHKYSVEIGIIFLITFGQEPNVKYQVEYTKGKPIVITSNRTWRQEILFYNGEKDLKSELCEVLGEQNVTDTSFDLSNLQSWHKICQSKNVEVTIVFGTQKQ